MVACDTSGGAVPLVKLILSRLAASNRLTRRQGPTGECPKNIATMRVRRCKLLLQVSDNHGAGVQILPRARQCFRVKAKEQRHTRCVRVSERIAKKLTNCLRAAKQTPRKIAQSDGRPTGVESLRMETDG